MELTEARRLVAPGHTVVSTDCGAGWAVVPLLADGVSHRGPVRAGCYPQSAYHRCDGDLAHVVHRFLAEEV